ncbi:hypothetical protein B9Z45_07840 [Limnohabitans sp. 2KL-17]|uniref:flagellar filament capping protein FliD n=1 Tax=Limnohabitans sp. 2KL-17 TaxID=1100704 RepID=UPI000D386AF2|nr:flagellar filament capping protein FliD [Limnohabitans sp. 2KL-17]PUE57991.1 hypothetical protein B9Z45_07840 [Limnohabitans sp. 2KL-17]
MAVNFVNALGAGSGIDTKSLAENLVEAERAPRKERVDAKITKSESQISGYGALKFALADLKAAFAKVNDRTEFSSIKPVNSQPTAFGVTASSAASTGTYSVKVEQIAQATRLGTTSFVASDTPINPDAQKAGQEFTLTFNVGTSTVHKITVPKNMATPAGMVSTVNSQTSTTGISAQLINTGSGYTVVYTGETGAAKKLSVSSTSITLLDDPLQVEQNAKLTINNLDIERTSNQVSDVIEGVTFDLYTPTSVAARVDMGRETTGVKENIKALVDAYNSFEDSVQILSDRDSKVEEFGGVLAGDSLIQSVRSQMRTMMTADYKVYTDPDVPVDPPLNPNIYAARHVGISFDRLGKLQLDEAALDTALQANFGEAVQLFTANSNNLSVYSSSPGGLGGAVFRSIDKMLRSTGDIEIKIKGTTDKIAQYKKDLVTLEDRMAKLLARYTEQFSAMDSIVGESTSTKTNLKSSFEGMMAMYTK